MEVLTTMESRVARHLSRGKLSPESYPTTHIQTDPRRCQTAGVLVHFPILMQMRFCDSL